MTNLHGVQLLPVDMDRAVEMAARSIPKKNGDYFCFANIHVVMEAHKDPELNRILDQSTANFPDGMGIALALKMLGHRFKDRVRGADFMLKLCSYAAQNNLKIFLYGNTEETLEALKQKLKGLFPKIQIAGAISPPFRPLTKEEDEGFIRQINQANPDILFVSLGAPKQERWMAEHKGRIKAIQLGVGAAFSFLTGKVKEAPKWMQKTALEWLFRLPQQPKKTIYRMSLVPGFFFMMIRQIVKSKR